jgi:hypothetical protein
MALSDLTDPAAINEAKRKSPLSVRTIALDEVFVTVGLVKLDSFHTAGVFRFQKQIGEAFRYEAFSDARRALQDQILLCSPNR